MSEQGCKVCRLLSERDMAQYNERLVEQWQGPPDQRMGYRRLATWLNVTMLRREMDRSGLDTLGNETESKYERLTGDDETIAREVRRSLREAGVFIDELLDDFVSYGVVRTHLKDCLGAERETNHSDSDWERDAIEIAQDHAETKVSEAVQTLVNKNKLSVIPGAEVTVEAEIQCPDCHLRVPLERAMRRGYVCDCPTSDADGQSEAEGA